MNLLTEVKDFLTDLKLINVILQSNHRGLSSYQYFVVLQAVSRNDRKTKGAINIGTEI